MSTSLLHGSQSEADQDCRESDESSEQPSTSEPFYSPLGMVSPLMATPTYHGKFTAIIIVIVNFKVHAQ